MTNEQFERLLVVITFMFIGTIFAIRGVGEAVTGDETWRIINNWMSMVTWVYATWRALYG
jgi:hypothetical protein